MKNLQELHRGGTKLSSVEGKGLETNRSAQNLRIAMGEPRPLFCSPVQPLCSRISAWISLHSRSGRRGGAMCLATNDCFSQRISGRLRAQRFINVTARYARQEGVWDWKVASTDTAGAYPTRVCKKGLPGWGGIYLTQARSHFRQKIWQQSRLLAANGNDKSKLGFAPSHLPDPGHLKALCCLRHPFSRYIQRA